MVLFLVSLASGGNKPTPMVSADLPCACQGQLVASLKWSCCWNTDLQEVEHYLKKLPEGGGHPVLAEPQSTERSPDWCLSHCSPAAQQDLAHLTRPKDTQVAALTVSIKTTTHAESWYCSLVGTLTAAHLLKRCSRTVYLGNTTYRIVL